MKLNFTKLADFYSTNFGKKMELKRLERTLDNLSIYSKEELELQLIQEKVKVEKQKILTPIKVAFMWLICLSLELYFFYRLYIDKHFYQFLKTTVKDFSANKYFSLANNMMLFMGIFFIVLAFVLTYITMSQYKQKVERKEILALKLKPFD